MGLRPNHPPRGRPFAVRKAEDPRNDGLISNAVAATGLRQGQLATLIGVNAQTMARIKIRWRTRKPAATTARLLWLLAQDPELVTLLEAYPGHG